MQNMGRTGFVVVVVFLLLFAGSAGLSSSTSGGAEAQSPGSLVVSSPAFKNNDQIPKKYTCDGRDTSPPLRFANTPGETKSLVLIVDDPDAPSGIWVHWVVWNIDPLTKKIDEGSVPAGAVQGRNDFGRPAYGGPCPPSGTHRYLFKVYALDKVVKLQAGAVKLDVEKEMRGHILREGLLTGLYKKGWF